MRITAVRTKLYRWMRPVKTDDTVFATPLSALAFQTDAQAPFRFFSWLVVEVETDDGRVGLGQRGARPDVTRQIVDAKLAPLVVGENPLNYGISVRKDVPLDDCLRPQGGGIAAISAVDIALWDLKGQRCKQPVFVLLGGRTKPAIPAYTARSTAATSTACSKRPPTCKPPVFAG